MMNPLKDLPPTLLCKLRSLVIHADEFLSPTSHAYDKIALENLLADVEVQEWLAEMDKLAMLPKKRLSK